MQTLARCSVLCAFALVSPCRGHFASLKAARRQQALQAAGLVSGQMAAIAQAEADDRRFWSKQWGEIEGSLQQLLQASGATEEPQARLSLVQAGNGPGANGQATSSSGVASHPAASAAGNATVEPKDGSPVELPKLNLNPKSAADLAPALAMLKALYEDGKERIAQLNTREKKTKKDFDERQAAHNVRMAQIEARFKNHTLSEEFYKNETHDENRIFSYWQRVRERQHRQFHTSLKIQHGTLAKVKNMIEIYEKTIAGKMDKTEVKKDLAKVGVAPEVVLLQEAWRSTVSFVGDALAEVRAASSELESSPPALQQ